MRFPLLALIFFTLFNTHAQIIDNSPYFKGFHDGYGIYHWTTSNGLPQSHISGITQSDNSLIYIATYDGIISYDGRKFNRLSMKFGKRDISPFVTTITACGDSLYWASTKEIVLFRNQKITEVVTFTDPRLFVPSIRKIGNSIYAFALSEIFEVKNKKLHSLLSNKQDKRLENYTFLTTLSYNGNLVTLAAKDQNSVLIVLDPVSGRYKIVPFAKHVENIAVRDNKLLFLSGKDWYLSNPDFTFGKTAYSTDLSTDGRFQSGITPFLTYFYNNQQLEILCKGERAAIDVSTLMRGNELFAALTDKTGNLWLGTNSNGLFMFRHYPFFYPTILNQLNVTNSSHTFLDASNTLWFDDDCNETIGMDIHTNMIRNRIPGLCSWVDEQWSEDTLIFMGYGTGNYWFNKKTGVKTPIETVTFPVNNCLKRSPRELIVTTDGMMYLFDGKHLKRWKTFRNKKTTCNQILRFHKDLFYFVTTEGLYRYKNGAWKLLIDSRLYDNADMRSVVLLKNTTQLIIGTSGKGLFRYDIYTDRFDQLPVVPTQLQNCWSIVEDEFQQLWITSNNGIVQINRQELRRSFWWQRQFMTINHYRYETGIENVEFNSRTQNKGMLLADGRILFSSLAGPIIIRPQNNASFNASMAGILCEKLTVNQKDIDLTTNPLSIVEGDFVQVQFTLPSFSLERVLQFEYRIKGYRDSWTVLNNRQVTLDNLPPGKYKLEIRLTSRKRSFELPITVAEKDPHAWIWFTLTMSLCILLVIGITFWLTRYIQRRIHAANSIKQQLKILEMEALRSQMNPHFIFNCLNTIQFLFISGQSDKANKYLSDFSSLMRLTLDQLRGSITTLETELKATQLYINLEQLQFDEGFKFRLVNNLSQPLNMIKTPSMFLQIFIENAIIHGLKRTREEHPILTLIMNETESSYVFEISDNGPGYNEQIREGHTSVGLNLLRDRFNLKSEVYNWEIDFYLKQNDSVVDDIRTTVVITFGKTLQEPTTT